MVFGFLTMSFSTFCVSCTALFKDLPVALLSVESASASADFGLISVFCITSLFFCTAVLTASWIGFVLLFFTKTPIPIPAAARAPNTTNVFLSFDSWLGM